MTQPAPSTVIPGMRYRRAPEAIDWLCSVLGFERNAVYPGPDNTVAQAQLTFGTGMIMLGSRSEPGSDNNEYSRLIKQPDEVGGAETRSVSLIVTDADLDLIYARVLAAHAEVVLPLEEKPYGGRAFTCRDPEGHLWDLGTYDPWSADSQSADSQSADSQSADSQATDSRSTPPSNE